MIVENQDETIAFLEHNAMASGLEVELASTHASIIFLIGDRAFKLKRAVRYPYLDFSTPERRLAACRTELALNRRTAPTLYLGVRTITREPAGYLVFDGTGHLVDAVVEMHRFSRDDLFDTMAQRGALTPQIITDLAHRIADFHKSATVSFTHGGVAGISAVLAINERALRATSLVTPAISETFAKSFQQALDRHSELLERRRHESKVRRCHGDLTLRNICLFDGVPTLFDCLEFNDELATIDVLYDLAFLLMDLWHRNLYELANIVFNRYLDECDETDGLPLIPFFMAIRAAVRAHVTATQANDAASNTASSLLAEARAYFDLASSLLVQKEAILLAIGGFSGSGKSTIASAVAPHLGPAPGARTLNSDRLRKRMHGIPVDTRLPAEAYRPEVSDKVYRMLRQEAAEILTKGCGVVTDAVFDRPSERRAIEDVATTVGVAFHGFWLDAPAATLQSRLTARHGGPSDATVEVLAAQLRRDGGEIAWTCIDAARNPAAVRDDILASLGVTS